MRFEADLKSERLDLDAATALVRSLGGPQAEWPEEGQLAFDFRSPVSGFTYRWGVQTFTGDNLMTVVIVGVAVVAMGAFFKFTDMGIAVRASAENGEHNQDQDNDGAGFPRGELR